MRSKHIEIDGMNFHLIIRLDRVGWFKWVYTAWLKEIKGVIVQERWAKNIEKSIRITYKVKKEYERNR